jgi:hypothetical protein
MLWKRMKWSSVRTSIQARNKSIKSLRKLNQVNLIRFTYKRRMTRKRRAKMVTRMILMKRPLKMSGMNSTKTRPQAKGMNQVPLKVIMIMIRLNIKYLEILMIMIITMDGPLIENSPRLKFWNEVLTNIAKKMEKRLVEDVFLLIMLLYTGPPKWIIEVIQSKFKIP